MSLKQLQNKTVWIVGASSGIGKQIALLCAYSNARVLLTDSSFSGVERTYAEVQKISSLVRIIPTDLSRMENIKETVEHITKKYGPIYLLIDNMGITGTGNFSKIGIDQFSEILDKRVKPLTFLIQTLIPSMEADGGGRIAFTGNVGGVYSGKGSSCYSVVQHAVDGLFRSIQAEHGKDKISLSIVSPVSISTEMGTGDSIRHPLLYRGQHDKKYLIMSSEKCAYLYLKRVLKGTRKIYINHKIRPLLIILRKINPFLFDKITGFGIY